MALPSPSSLIKQRKKQTRKKLLVHLVPCAMWSFPPSPTFPGASSPGKVFYRRNTVFLEWFLREMDTHGTVYSRVCTVAESFPRPGSVISRTSFWVHVHWGSWQLCFMEVIQVESCVPWLPHRPSSTDSHGELVWAAAALGWGQTLCLHCCSFLPSRAWSGTQAVFPGHDHGSWRQILLGAHQPSYGNVSGRPAVPAFNPQDAGIKAGPRERTAFGFDWLL